MTTGGADFLFSGTGKVPLNGFQPEDAWESQTSRIGALC